MENIYGHQKRLEWIISQCDRLDEIVEVGCGTGYMIVVPLAKKGFTVHGIDTDEKSIAYGRDLLARQGMDPGLVTAADFASIGVKADVIIASEVLEHIPNEGMPGMLSLISGKLKPGGKLLVTVPNGYGWFELESVLWFKAGLGRLMERCRIDYYYKQMKILLFGEEVEDMTPSSLSNSPHVQRFTYRSIKRLLAKSGFDVVDATGSVLFCGPFSNLFFSGIRPIMKLNGFLGSLMPCLASGFYIAARKR